MGAWPQVSGQLEIAGYTEERDLGQKQGKAWGNLGVGQGDTVAWVGVTSWGRVD